MVYPDHIYKGLFYPSCMSVYVPATYNSVTVFFVVDCVPATNWAPPWWNHEANGNCEWDLFWSGLRTLGWLVADVSGEPICLRFRGQDMTHKLSRNVADIRAYTTQQPRRAKISTTLLRKTEMSPNRERYVQSP